MASSSVLRIVNFLGILHLVVGVHIEIEPNRYTDQTANNQVVQITCRPGNVLQCADKDVLMLQLRKTGHESLAFVNFHQGKSKVTAVSDSFQAKGYIGRRCDKSYLRATLSSPRNDDSGRYQCSMFYYDKTGAYLEEKASGKLTVELFHVNPVVKNLLKKVSELEHRLEVQSSKVSDNAAQSTSLLSQLQRETHLHKERITGLENKVSVSNNAVQNKLQELAELDKEAVKRIAGLEGNVSVSNNAVQNKLQELAELDKEAAERIAGLEGNVSDNEAGIKKLDGAAQELQRETQIQGDKIARLEIWEISAHLFQRVQASDGKEFLYYTSPDEMNYYVARAHCLSLGAYLIHFDSEHEMEALRKFVANQKVNKGDAFLVGANDIETEGKWLDSLHGEPLDASMWKWHDGEPNNRGDEDCAIIILGEGLHDIPCSDEFHFICERTPL